MDGSKSVTAHPTNTGLVWIIRLHASMDMCLQSARTECKFPTMVMRVYIPLAPYDRRRPSPLLGCRIAVHVYRYHYASKTVKQEPGWTAASKIHNHDIRVRLSPHDPHRCGKSPVEDGSMVTYMQRGCHRDPLGSYKQDLSHTYTANTTCGVQRNGRSQGI